MGFLVRTDGSARHGVSLKTSGAIAYVRGGADVGLTAMPGTAVSGRSSIVP